MAKDIFMSERVGLAWCFGYLMNWIFVYEDDRVKSVVWNVAYLFFSAS